MPTRYTNGTANAEGYYSGINLTNENDLLALIRDELVIAGQTVHLDEITSNKKLIMKGVDNGDNCWVIFESETVSGINKNLKITGDLDGTQTSLGKTLKLDFKEDGNCQFYMTSDEGGGCLMPYNTAGGPSKSAHFGFPERHYLGNPRNWMTGYLDEWLTDACIATSTMSNEVWKEFKEFYYSSNESKTQPQGGYTFLWDYYCTNSQKSQQTTANNTAFSYKPWLGAVDPVTFEAKLAPLAYEEGPGDYNDWTPAVQNKGNPKHVPGHIRFARTGLASFDTGKQVKQGTKVFISGGPAGDYQGFQIAA